MRQFKSAVIFGLLFVLGFAAEGAPVVTKHLVKGFEIYLIDMKAGNRIGMTYVVPYGSANDEPKFFGRAHFFEHMSGRGSLHFPGHDTMDRELKNIGFENNAATGVNFTLYYAVGNDKQALRAMDVHFDPLHGLELEQGAFEREKKTVINEIIDTAPNRPERAKFEAPYMRLLPANHSLNGNHMGTLETLEPMSPDDLRALHREIYRPGQVKIAILGNFTSGQWKAAQIIEHFDRILPSENSDSVPTKKPHLPETLFARADGPQILEIEGTPNSSGLIHFVLPQGANAEKVAHFLTAIGSPYRGGLGHDLKIVKGWTTGIYGWGLPLQMGSHRVATIDVRLTDSGHDHRDEVVAAILRAIDVYRRELLPESVVSRLRQSHLHDYIQLEKSLDGLLETFPHLMVKSEAEDQLRLDWPAYVGKMTPESIREGARALDLNQMAVVFQSAKVESPEGTLPIYNLHFRRRDLNPNRFPSELPPLSLAQITVPNTELIPHVARGQILNLNSWRSGDQGDIEVHLASPHWTGRTVQVVLDLPRLTALEELSFEAWVSGFREEYYPEMTDLGADGIQIEISGYDGRLVVQVEDERHRELPALQWVLQNLRKYQIKPETLARIRENIQKSSARRETGEFPAEVAGNVAREILSRRGLTRRSFDTAEPLLTQSTVENVRSHVSLTAGPILLFSGPFYESEVAATKTLLAEFAPLSADRRNMGDRVSVQHERLTYIEPWVNSSSVGLGVVRLMRIPGAWQLKSRMALSVAKQLMHDRVFSRNRQYGYVQGVTLARFSHMDHHLKFYGQANDQQALDKVVEGWDVALAGWDAGAYTNAEIEEGVAGVLATLEQELETSEDAADAALMGLAHFNNPYANKLMIQALKSLTPADVRAAVAEYLHPSVGQLTVVKGPGQLSCGELLTDIASVRSRLMSSLKDQ